MDVSFAFDVTEFAGMAKIVGLCIMLASTYNIIHVKPFPYEPIFSFAAVICVGFALGMQSVVGICFALTLAVT